METGKSFSGEEAEKDFCGRLFFLAAIFPFSNEKACLGVTAKTDFFYRLKQPKGCFLLFFCPHEEHRRITQIVFREYARTCGFVKAAVGAAK